jgi:hypothetical protein
MTGLRFMWETDAVNRLIGIPEGEITLQDGRQIIIQQWEPLLSAGDVAHVRVTGILREAPNVRDGKKPPEPAALYIGEGSTKVEKAP